MVLDNSKHSKMMFVSIIQYVLRKLPLLLLLLSITVVGVLLLIGEIKLLQYASFFIIPLVIISILTIIKNKDIYKYPLEYLGFKNKYNIKSNKLLKIYLIFYCITLIWITINQSLDFVFILLLTILSLILLTQIFVNEKPKPYLYLIEIILLIGLALFSKNLIYEVNFISSDFLEFNNIIDYIVYYGNLPIEALNVYANFALYHIFGSIGIELTGLTENIAFVCGSIPSLICITIFTFYITKRIVINYCKYSRIAVLSSFFMLMIPIVYEYISAVPTRSIILSLFLLLAYLFFEQKRFSPIIIACITLVTSAAIIYFHHVSLFIIIILCFIICIYCKIINVKLSQNQKVILCSLTGLCIIKLVFVYIYSLIRFINVYFIDKIISGELFYDTQMRLSTGGYASSDNIYLSTILSILPSFAIIIIIMGGIYLIRSPKFNSKTLIFIKMICILGVVLFIPGMADTIYIISSYFEIDRFRLYFSIFFAIVMGIGSIFIYNLLMKITKFQVLSIIAIIFICLFPFIATVCINNEYDNNIFINTDFSQQRGFTNNEVIGFTFVELNIPSGSLIMSDFFSTRYFKNYDDYAFSNFSSYNLYPNIEFIIEIDDYFNINGDEYLLLRSNTVEKYGLFVLIDSYYSYFTIDKDVVNSKKMSREYNLIYNSAYIDILH